MSESLTSRLKVWAHDGTGVNVVWKKDENSVSVASPKAAVQTFEGLFEGELPRFGHGLQRSFIFALLQELAEYDENGGPLLVLGVEEPELYQHPPQARYLASVLSKLSGRNSQILVCTHSPYFVSGKGFENLRMFHKNQPDGDCSVKQTTFEELAQRIASATGETPQRPGGVIAQVEQELLGPMNEMFFASVCVFVEGLEDAAYLSSYLTLTETLPEFREHGCHIVQVQGKSHLIQAIAIAQELGMPVFTIFDADSDARQDNGDRKKHEDDNIAILKLHGIANPTAFPDETFKAGNLVMWKTNIGDVVKSEFGANWAAIEGEVRRKYKNYAGGMQKNSLFIGYKMAEAWDQNIKSQTLVDLCEHILQYARQQIEVDEPGEVMVAAAAVPIEQ